MSLIKCPECGEDISASAEHCVHCGCKINVCPDCGYAAVRRFATCPNCGCIISDNTKSGGDITKRTDSSTTSGSVCKDFYDKWTAASPLDSVLLKRKKVITWVVDGVGAILIAIALIVFFSWNSGNQLAQLNDFRDTVAILRPLVILFVVFQFFPTKNIIKFILSLRLVKRIKKENISVVDYIKEMKNSVVSADEQGYAFFCELFIGAAYMRVNSSEKKWFVLNMLIDIAVYALLITGLAIFIDDNIDAFLMSVMLNVSFKGEYTWLIVAGVITVVYILVDVVDVTGFEARSNKWLSKI